MHREWSPRDFSLAKAWSSFHGSPSCSRSSFRAGSISVIYDMCLPPMSADRSYSRLRWLPAEDKASKFGNNGSIANIPRHGDLVFQYARQPTRHLIRAFRRPCHVRVKGCMPLRLRDLGFGSITNRQAKPGPL